MRSKYGRSRTRTIERKKKTGKRYFTRQSRFGVGSIMSIWDGGTRKSRIRTKVHPRRKASRGNRGGFWYALKSWWLAPGKRRFL